MADIESWPRDEHCQRCNCDTHRCPGCGEPLPHGTEICVDCGRDDVLFVDAALTEKEEKPMIALSHFTTVFFESAPWMTGSRVDPDEGRLYDVDVLTGEALALPRKFTLMLDTVISSPDALRCVRCLDAVGFLLEEFDDYGPGHLVWAPTGLVCENDGPVRVMCEACTPHVPEDHPVTTQK